MADEESIPSAEPIEESDLPTGGGRSLVGKAMILAFVLVVVLVEFAVALFVFPSAEDTDAMVQAMLAEKGKPAAVLADEPLEIEELDEDLGKEIDMGDFDVSSYQPLSNTTLRISAHLYALAEEKDESLLMELLEEKQQRVREQVIVILRSAELTDLTDTNLGLIKRKILETTNRTLGKPILKDILIPEFSFLEQ